LPVSNRVNWSKNDDAEELNQIDLDEKGGKDGKKFRTSLRANMARAGEGAQNS
jgi:hypothetical protein